MAVTASFSPGSGTLTVLGDNLDNTIATSRDAAGKLLVNGGAVTVVGGTATVANTSLIQLFGQGGNDVLRLDETNGALPRANLFGGSGNDTLIGGSGGDMLFGQSGNDVLDGKAGIDSLFGGSEDDILTGGDGNDQLFGESGNDRMVWNPGDDSDLMEGGSGVDTVQVNGGNGSEVFTIAANGTRVRFDRLDPAPFFLDIGASENLELHANGGDDIIGASGDLASLIKLTLDGGAGNDQIRGGNGADLLLGGDGNDLVDGNQGNDVALLGAGDDLFQWDPGDGSDTVEGQSGNDALTFNGSAIGERFELSANGQRARLTRDVAAIVMDLDDVERIDVNALGGADTFTVGDLAGTDVVDVRIHLEGALGGATGDAQADTVITQTTNGADSIDVLGTGTSATVVGLSALVSITGAEGASDALIVNGLGGADRISASTLVAGIVKLTLDGGSGDDTLLGSRGADVLLGGDGNDFVDGQQGNDLALLGPGNDVFQWDPGDGSDTVEGQAGADVLVFNGSNVGEAIDIASNGGRVRFFRDIAAVTMDLDDVERIDFHALGGADNVVVGNLLGTDVTRVAIDLGAAGGIGDGQIDVVTVNATPIDDAVVVDDVGGVVSVVGLAAQTTIANPEATDRLVINGLGGADVIDASAVDAGRIALEVNGGLGVDLVRGSQGGDLINGGDGNDVAFMGAGDDRFAWNPGDDNDTIEGEAGFDTLQVNGSGANESVDIASNGARVRLFRDVASVTLDGNGVEQIEFAARGGADNIVVNDLSGTGAVRVRLDLASAPGGGGDGQTDTVTINATQGDDAIFVSQVGSDLFVDGLAARIVIANFEPAIDRLVINGLGGSDVIDTSALLAGFGISANGGDGDDVLLGGAGDDVLRGGAGDDVLLGNAGNDLLDGGAGEDVLIGGDGDDVLLDGEVQIASVTTTMGLRDLLAMDDPALVHHVAIIGCADALT